MAPKASLKRKNGGAAAPDTGKKPRPNSAITANWGKSKATELKLQELVTSQVLPPKDIIHWRGATDETRPRPDKGEIVVFTEHVTRRFRPPGSLFFREVLQYYGLRPQDIGPNSVLNMSNFTVLCESYLQIPPNLNLFLDLFHCKTQSEYTGGPLLQCGGVSIQRRRQSQMPALKLLSHTKDWHKTFFYCQDTSFEKEPSLPGYTVEHLALNDNQNSFAEDEEWVKMQPLLKKIEVLVAHGLKGTDLIKTWMGWRIQPLSIRDDLFCRYSGKLTDSLRY